MVPFFKALYVLFCIWSPSAIGQLCKNDSSRISACFAIEFNIDSSLYFNLKNQGDLLHRIYVQVDIPVLSLTDSIITDSNYTTEKSSRLSTISTSKTSWTTKHTNLVNFAEIEITYYKTFTEALSADTCTVSILQSKLIKIFGKLEILLTEKFVNKIKKLPVQLVIKNE